MKLIKPSFEIWEQEPSLEGVFKQIERAGRVCYKSEDKIAEGTARAFVDRMIASGHGAMLEHGTIYLAIPITTGHSGMSELRYIDNKYSIVTESTGLSMKDEHGDKCDCWCVTTNLRVLIENDWLEDTWYLCEPTEYHAKRITVKFVCDRGVSHKEFVA
jgi:thymidylate synthase (FAD)